MVSFMLRVFYQNKKKKNGNKQTEKDMVQHTYVVWGPTQRKGPLGPLSESD